MSSAIALDICFISYYHSIQYPCQRCNCNAIIRYGNTLRLCLAHTRKDRAASEHTRTTMNHYVIPRKVVGEVIAAHNINLQTIAQLAMQ